MKKFSATRITNVMRLCHRFSRRKFSNARREIRAYLTIFWIKIYLRGLTAGFTIRTFFSRNFLLVVFVLLLLSIVISSYWTWANRDQISLAFPNLVRLENFQSLLLNVGSALLGAIAIVFSLIMFAMQVNIERMPHGLFRRLSTDKFLLGAFVGPFMLALLVASASIIDNPRWVFFLILLVVWVPVITLLAFVYSYRRALFLINPLNQIQFLVTDAASDLHLWAKRSERVSPMLQMANDDQPEETRHDLSRIQFLNVNQHWTSNALRAIQHAISIALRYASYGDHEVSGAAFTAVVQINRAYVIAKGRTFFSTHAFWQSPLSSDAFINVTLEHFRQTAQVSLKNGDEQLIEMIFQALSDLTKLYAQIDYGNTLSTKTHAHLSARYLTDAVLSVLPQEMTDVAMRGIGLMGDSARVLARFGGPNEAVTVIEKMGQIACAGVIKEDLRPVIVTTMEELTRITQLLLISKRREVRFALGRLRDEITIIAKLTLNLTDKPLSNTHSAHLAPYFSSSQPDSFVPKLIDIANQLLSDKLDSDVVKKISFNIKEWADGIAQPFKELLLLAVEKRSGFVFDVIHWITQVAKVLIVISDHAKCPTHLQDSLRKHALYLLWSLNWIPDDKDAIAFVENYSMTDALYEIARDLRHNESQDVIENTQQVLMEWTFKAGRYESGRGTLEKGLLGLSVLTSADNLAAEKQFLQTVSKHLLADSAPDQSNRDRAARELRRSSVQLPMRETFTLDRIECDMQQSDHERLAPLLKEVADLLSPDTRDEPVDLGWL